MSNVKTYAVNCNDAWLNTGGDDISGSYVKYADYAALQAKCDELLEEIKNMQDQALDDGCRIAELEEALLDKQALIPDEHDTTAQQFESLAKSEWLPVHINYQCALCGARFSGGILMNNHKRRRYTTGAKIFIAVYLLALAAAIAGVVHYV